MIAVNAIVLIALIISGLWVTNKAIMFLNNHRDIPVFGLLADMIFEGNRYSLESDSSFSADLHGLICNITSQAEQDAWHKLGQAYALYSPEYTGNLEGFRILLPIGAQNKATWEMIIISLVHRYQFNNGLPTMVYSCWKKGLPNYEYLIIYYAKNSTQSKIIKNMILDKTGNQQLHDTELDRELRNAR